MVTTAMIVPSLALGSHDAPRGASVVLAQDLLSRLSPATGRCEAWCPGSQAAPDPRGGPELAAGRTGTVGRRALVGTRSHLPGLGHRDSQGIQGCGPSGCCPQSIRRPDTGARVMRHPGPARRGRSGACRGRVLDGARVLPIGPWSPVPRSGWPGGLRWSAMEGCMPSRRDPPDPSRPPSRPHRPRSPRCPTRPPSPGRRRRTRVPGAARMVPGRAAGDSPGSSRPRPPWL